MPQKFVANTYARMRATQWKGQGGAETYDKVDFHGSRLKNGEPLDAVYLAPKMVLTFKDVWHCPSQKEAKKIAREILQYGDVNWLELKGAWVWVQYVLAPESSEGHELPGQKLEDRTRVRGR